MYSLTASHKREVERIDEEKTEWREAGIAAAFYLGNAALILHNSHLQMLLSRTLDCILFVRGWG